MSALLENTNKPTADRELTITRVLDAPRDLVWRAWTDPLHVMQWMGPKIFTSPSCEMDLRPGGAYRVCLRPNDGEPDIFFQGVYQEIDKPQRLVFTFAWDENHGGTGYETTVSLTFEEAGNGTRMTLHQGVFQSTEVRDDHNDGWNSCLDRLEELLQSGEAK